MLIEYVSSTGRRCKRPLQLHMALLMREPRSPEVNLASIYPQAGNPNAPSRSRQLVRYALLGVAVCAVVAVLIGVLSPASTFKAATRGSGGPKTASKAPGPAPATVKVSPMDDPAYPYRPLQTMAPTPAGLPPGLIQDKAPAGGDSEEEDGYGATTTDDVDDDYGDDYPDPWYGVGSQLDGSTNAAYNSLVLSGWRAVGGAASRLCYATTGRQLREMASGTDCTVIILTRPRSKPYTLAKTVVVKGYKIVIGNPIDLPIVDGYIHHLDRCFEGEVAQKTEMKRQVCPYNSSRMALMFGLCSDAECCAGLAVHRRDKGLWYQVSI